MLLKVCHAVWQHVRAGKGTRERCSLIYSVCCGMLQLQGWQQHSTWYGTEGCAGWEAGNLFQLLYTMESNRHVMFSFSVTVCVRPEVQNGRIVGSQAQFKPVEKITLECDPGYMLKGNHTTQCQFDGTWDPPVPICAWGM